MSLTARVADWSARGELRSVAGRQLFVYERPGEGVPVLLLHGYPSSSYDWRDVVARLPGRHLILFDFLGYGLSDKPRDVLYSLMMQADLVEAVADGRELHLVAHDMGSSVATELLARDIERRLTFGLRSALLTNASLVLEKASLTISQKLLRSPLGPLFARLSNERSFRLQFARIFSSAHPLSAEEAADQWSLLAHNRGQRLLNRLIYYLHERIEYAPRWHGAIRDWPGELSLAWARRDPICTEAVLQAVLALRPSAPLTRFDDLGHYPQIEDPGSVAAVIDGHAT
ncbi:MAG TPA: alpha/beta hydrolase [Solirubrobacteraceae bacterium]|nr:alpha/beta hydrolase [Solirubrobacteraceae bacterium]